MIKTNVDEFLNEFYEYKRIYNEQKKQLEKYRGIGIDFFLNDEYKRLDECLKKIEKKSIYKYTWIDNLTKSDEILLTILGYVVQFTYRIPKDILKEKDNIVLYGAGDVGKAFYGHICSEQLCNINGWVDRDTTKAEDISPVSDITKFSFDYVLIAIFDEKNAKKIKINLMDIGVEEEKILWVRPIKILEKISKRQNYLKDAIVNSCKDKYDKLFMITGAQFNNSGAQSMLFCMINMLCEKYDNCGVIYWPVDNKNQYSDEIKEKYNFIIMNDGEDLGSSLFEIMPMVDGIYDVSGYSFFAGGNIGRYEKVLLFSYLYDVPLYIMPQSFGPFEFNECDKEYFKILLSRAKIIYAREEESYRNLTDVFNLKNVQCSDDLVLLSKKINFDYIYRYNKFQISEKIETKSNVAIIPNFKNYIYGNESEIVGLYRKVIDYLLIRHKNIYIISHAEDIEVCKELWKEFADESNVHLINRQLDCIEYSDFIKKFDYIIASRYHSIVHAYKQGIPAVIMGWSYKYNNLAKLFEQDRYVFMVNSGIEDDKLMEALNVMDNEYKKESEVILKLLKKKQFNQLKITD